MNQYYETMYILRPTLSEEQVQEQISKYENFLSEHGATEIQVQQWGKRKLAYPIQKHSDGIYLIMNYSGDGSQIAPLERAMRLSEEVIRYLTIKLQDSQPVAISSQTEVSEVVSESEEDSDLEIAATEN
jgi:small subunit ribosomal protein S6